ncbi:SCO family protein [Psychroserpens burtonensis]|uniref:SCO family protein n=1 Tax=Psychroserpens burtonensis TaxID=49278 RepID=A0A5C7BBG2_9FLAO|nr:SCO family protein [Psychroserpens burtonensis]TXE19996.1 SCO family protein [Psychroserpens burtonensis]
MSLLKDNRFTAILIITLLLLVFYFSYSYLFPTNTLPIYNPSNFNPELVDKHLQNKTQNHRVSDFELINQNGQVITQDNYKDKIYVTDFFFTRCGSICPIMTDNMTKIQEEFIDNDDIMFLSLSVTPKIDSVSVLKEYATNKGVIDSKWNITTGDKKHIYELARQSYFAVVEQGDGGLQDFIHTPNFILIDKEKQIRGIYDGTKDQDIKRLISEIYVLEN